MLRLTFYYLGIGKIQLLSVCLSVCVQMSLVHSLTLEPPVHLLSWESGHPLTQEIPAHPPLILELGHPLTLEPPVHLLTLEPDHLLTMEPGRLLTLVYWQELL